MEIIITGIAGFLVGGIVAWVIYAKAMKSRSQKIVREAEAEAEVIKKDKILQAKEKFLQLRTEHEKEINSRNSKVVVIENKLKRFAVIYSKYGYILSIPCNWYRIFY